MHWSKAHDIRVAQVREILGVPKRVVFVSDETRAKMRANLKARGPELSKAALLVAHRVRRGKPNPLTPGGRESFIRQMAVRSRQMWEEDRTKMLAATRRGAAKKKAKTARLPCVICGEPCVAPITANTKNVRKTCSEKCSEVLRSRRYKVRDDQVREIRRRVAAGETHAQVAKAFGVSRRWVGKVVNRNRRKAACHSDTLASDRR